MTGEPTFITLENAPRDEAKLAALSRNVRYRLALHTNIVKMSSPEEQQSWVSMNPQEQARVLLGALAEYDKAKATGLPQTIEVMQTTPIQANIPVAPPTFAPTPVTPPAPLGISVTPVAIQPIAPTAPVAPVQPPVQMPVQMPAQMAPVPPPMGGIAVPSPITAPVRVPTMAAVPQELPQITAPHIAAVPTPQQSPLRNPTTPSDPTNMGGKGAAKQHPSEQVDRLTRALNEFRKELESRASNEDLVKLHETILGLARTINVLGIVILEMAENQLGLDKDSIVDMATAAMQVGELEKLLQDPGENG